MSRVSHNGNYMSFPYKMLMLFGIFALNMFGVWGQTITSVFPNQGSTQGGTYLVIAGSGFQMPVQANPWDSEAVYVGNILCDIVAHYTTATQIVCITRPASVAYSTSPALDVTVQVFWGLGQVATAIASQAFIYSYMSTPTFEWASRWAGTAGDVITFAQRSNDYRSNGGIWQTPAHWTIMVGDAPCLTNQPGHTGVGTSATDADTGTFFDCILMDSNMTMPGMYNISTRLRVLDPTGSCPNGPCFPTSYADAGMNDGLGNGTIVTPYSTLTHNGGPPTNADYYTTGRVIQDWAGTVDLATGNAFHFSIYPQISSVAPLTGSTFGGNNLTIAGTAFAPSLSDNIVLVGGAPCQVVQASIHQLVCTLGTGPTPYYSSLSETPRVSMVCVDTPGWNNGPSGMGCGDYASRGWTTELDSWE